MASSAQFIERDPVVKYCILYIESRPINRAEDAINVVPTAAICREQRDYIMSQYQSGRQVLSSGIISDPQINGGKPIVEGTRVPVKIVLVDIAQGMSVQDTPSGVQRVL